MHKTSSDKQNLRFTFYLGKMRLLDFVGWGDEVQDFFYGSDVRI